MGVSSGSVSEGFEVGFCESAAGDAAAGRVSRADRAGTAQPESHRRPMAMTVFNMRKFPPFSTDMSPAAQLTVPENPENGYPEPPAAPRRIGAEMSHAERFLNAA